MIINFASEIVKDVIVIISIVNIFYFFTSSSSSSKHSLAHPALQSLYSSLEVGIVLSERHCPQRFRDGAGAGPERSEGRFDGKTQITFDSEPLSTTRPNFESTAGEKVLNTTNTDH